MHGLVHRHGATVAAGVGLTPSNCYGPCIALLCSGWSETEKADAGSLIGCAAVCFGFDGVEAAQEQAWCQRVVVAMVA